MPTSDAQPSRFLPRRPHMISPTYSMPVKPQMPPPATFPILPPSGGPAQPADHEHAIDFATHSWDLATGGLKTMTAKRELPTRPDRRAPEIPPGMLVTHRNYMFALVVLACVVLMLIGGGIVLFVMLQP
ncbi:MAG TPA: hypothetical protein VFU49_16880 [Ktedonobacteraceae bacterium]|nr:hypothetical protein [Ktedonobacteraceae bacterium]